MLGVQGGHEGVCEHNESVLGLKSKTLNPKPTSMGLCRYPGMSCAGCMQGGHGRVWQKHLGGQDGFEVGKSRQQARESSAGDFPHPHCPRPNLIAFVLPVQLVALWKPGFFV